MPARPIPSLASDDELFARLDSQRTRRAAAATSATNDTAERLSRLRQAYQWIPAGTLAALAQAGIEPGSDIAELASKASAKRKSKSGLGWHSIGDVVSAGARAIDTGLGGLDEAAARSIKPAVRGVTLGAQSLYEEAQGAVRNVAAWDPGGLPVGAALAAGGTAAALAVAAPVSIPAAGIAAVAAGGAALGVAASSDIQGDGRWEPQSSGAISLERLLRGEKVELGSGFLPNVNAGEDEENPDSTLTIGEEQRQRARRVTIGGRSLTPGRLLATGVVEPGTTPHNLLSGLVDASLALSRFDPSSAVLKTAGNVNRNRKLFVEAGGLFANRPTILPEVADKWWTGATELRKTLAETQGKTAFYDIWKATDGKLGARVTSQIAKATTEAEVDAIIRPRLGFDNGIRGPIGFDTFKPLSNVRLAQTMPGSHFDPEDADKAVTSVELWLKNAKASPELIAEATGRMAEQATAVGRFGVLEEVMETTRKLLIEEGVVPDRARRMTKLDETAEDDARAFFVKTLAGGETSPGMFIDGDVHGVVSPHLPSEFINRTVSLPDVRDIRRATSGFSALTDKELYKGAVSAVDFAQGQVWKRTALMRAAYTIRVITEEQVRMAASGLDSMINHPLSLIAFRLGQKGGADIKGGEFKYQSAKEMAGALDEYNQALNRGFAGWIDPVKVFPHWRRLTKVDGDFADAAASEIMQLAGDTFGREVAKNLQDLDAFKAAGWGNGASRMEDAANGLERVRLRMAEQAGGLKDRQTWDTYVDSIADRITYKTGARSELVDAIATGKFAGKDVFDDGRFRPTKELRDFIAANVDMYADDTVMKLQLSVADRGAGKWLDQATQFVFSNLMGERTNNLSRGPTFQQFYGRRVEELVPWMDQSARDGTLAWAREFKLNDVAKRLEASYKKHPAGARNFDEIDNVAKGYALDETKKLLYDMTERSQFFDAARIIAPFGEAWKEVVTRWAKIGIEQPQTIRRASQVIEGARSSGFFYTNENGEEVFAYPGSGWISEKLFGVKVPLTGRVAGLSLMTEVVPGVGPVAQMTAGAILPDAPEWDRVQSILFPFGELDTSGGVIESVLPAWVNKFRQAGWTPFSQDEGQWNSTVMDVARWLSSTGEYDTSTVDGMNTLLDAARTKAKGVYALRGAAQFFAPTAPTPEWVALDKNGDALVVQALISEYQELLEKDPQSATLQMLDRYGEQVFLLLQGKTAEVTPGAPVSDEGADWERANPGIVQRYENVFGFFAPQGGDLDSAAFGRQLEKGRRVRITPEQAVRLAHDRVARAIYNEAKRKVPSPNLMQATALRTLKGALKQKYPGAFERVGIPEKASVDQLITELTDAAADERLKDNPVVGPLRTYLAARETVAQAGQTPTSFRSSQAMAGARAALRILGEALSEKTPAFQALWERVFDSELADEAEVLDGAAA